MEDVGAGEGEGAGAASEAGRVSGETMRLESSLRNKRSARASTSRLVEFKRGAKGCHHVNKALLGQREELLIVCASALSKANRGRQVQWRQYNDAVVGHNHLPVPSDGLVGGARRNREAEKK